MARKNFFGYPTDFRLSSDNLMDVCVCVYVCVGLCSLIRECGEHNICHLGQGTSQHIAHDRDTLECALSDFLSTK